MEKYIIFQNKREYRVYVDTIYRNSVSTDRDIGEAIEFSDIDMAKSICSYINVRENIINNEDKYKILEVSTQFKEI